MKAVKKILASVLAIAMVLSLSMTAFADVAPAAPTGTITIRNSLPGREYSIYKIFDAVPSEDGEHVSYTYAGTLDPDNGYFEQDSAGNITATDDAYGDDGYLTSGAIEFLAGLKPSDATASATAEGSTLEFEVPYGYYYIEATGQTAVTVDTTMPDVTVIDKNDIPGWDNGDDPDDPFAPGPGKVIVEADGSKVTENSVNYGDTVNFSIAVNAYSFVASPSEANVEQAVPQLVTYYHITDELADGFGPAQNITVKITETDGTVSDITDELNTNGYIEQDGNKFDITVPFGEMYGSMAKIEVTYSAIVNANGEDVVIAGDGNPNKANFTYDTEPFDPDDDPFDPTDPTDPKYPDPDPDPEYDPENEVETITYVYAIGIQKVDDIGTALEGAKFKVTKKDDTTAIKLVSLGEGVYRIATTSDAETTEEAESPASGTIIIKGLEAGTYTLTETVPPKGYNLLKDPIDVEAEFKGTYTNTIKVYKNDKGEVVTEETETYDEIEDLECKVVPVVVKNEAGIELPSTGGVGTTIFYILGSILLVGAAILLITKKRMSTEQ